MDSLMTKVANHKSLSSASCHDFDPSWSFSAPFLKICELSDMIHFHILSRSTQFAFLGKESFDQFVTFWSCDSGLLINEYRHWLSFERYAPKSSHKRFLSFSWDVDFQALVRDSVCCLETCFVLAPLRFHAALVLVGKGLEEGTAGLPVQFPKPADVVGKHIILHHSPIFLLVMVDDGKIIVFQQLGPMMRFSRLLIEGTFAFDDIWRNEQPNATVGDTPFLSLLGVALLVHDMVVEETRLLCTRMSNQGLFLGHFELEPFS
jgi:hypothetical protein